MKRQTEAINSKLRDRTEFLPTTSVAGKTRRAIVNHIAIAGAALLLCLGAGTPGAHAAPAPAETGSFAGSDAWFDTMRKLPANETLVLALAKTNYVVGLPYDCVEVAGFITFPEGNPFAGGPLPELNIVCRDRSVDASMRIPRLDESAHFYSVFKRGQTYEFYWKRGKEREKFCTLQVSSEAQQRQKLSIPYPPPKPEPPANPIDSQAELPRDRASISREYDLSGFPSNPGSEDTKKIAEAMKYARSNSARAAAHEMLARYYRDTRLDSNRAQSEFKKAEALKAAPGQ